MNHSPKFEKVKMYYDEGLWGEDRVRNAVTHPTGNPWITADEYEEIVGAPYYD